jgi:FlaA1/EpsC-like NDP-sugar epimerase
MLIFFLALTLGFAFELGKNALKIDSRQMLTLINYKISTISTVSSLFNFIHKILSYFTLAKFCGAILTVTILAMIKYLIFGGFHIEYGDFFNNIAMGLLG